MEGPNTGDGGGPDRPSLDDARVVEPADPAAALGRPQAARATAEANSGPSASRGMTTVQWGATTPSALVRNSKPLSPADHKRAARALGGTTIYEQVIKISNRDFGTVKAWRQLVRKTAATVPLVPAIVIDADLAKLLREKRLSILPPGVVEVRGDFEEADLVSVLDPSGNRLALSMAEYRSHDLRDIKGHHSSQIAEILGKYCGPSVVSRRLSVWEIDLAKNTAPQQPPIPQASG